VARALLEGICAQKGVEGRTLYNKIDGLKQHLPANIVDSLHHFRFIGNEAAHELQAPSEAELRLAIEMTEDLLNFLYELIYVMGNFTWRSYCNLSDNTSSFGSSQACHRATARSQWTETTLSSIVPT